MNLAFKLVIYLILVSTLSFELLVNCNDNSDLLPSTIQIILLVHPFNKAQVLPFTLGGIEQQNYIKTRINVYIQTEKIDYDTHEYDEEVEENKQNNKMTIDMVKRWVKDHKDEYNDIELVIGNEMNDNEDVNYWNYNRFKRVIKMKEEGFKLGRKNWADFILFIDADVVLTNENTFLYLTNNTNGMVVIAPMLYSLGTYSNFWAGITKNGYYKRTDDYLPILERQNVGQFQVPMIHSCVFVNLRHKLSNYLTFDGRQLSDNLPFDDIISFAKSAELGSIPLYIDNREVWGYIPPPIDNNSRLNSLQQDLIDLELESLVEGPSFPISNSLFSYILTYPKDKLNVDNIYMINLERRFERRNRMLKCFDLLGIEVQIWPAIDGKLLSFDKIKSKGIKLMENYLDPYHKRPMTFGEIGCFLSHYEIWQDIIKRNFSNAIIFEDDVRFERNLKYKWKKAFSSLNTNEYDFVYLGRKRQGDNESQIGNFFVTPSYSYWTLGYFITAKGAQKLLDAKPLEKLIPVDEFLPIMYDSHPIQEWISHFTNRNLKALSIDPLLIFPTHYVGDSLYISDTEDSKKIDNQETVHPKHSEL